MGNSTAAYLEGIRLFNAGHYWLAHEQWEACWLACRWRDTRVEDMASPEGAAALDEEMHFYQALIQAAAALVKWQQGNRRGLALNWAKSRARLVNLPLHYQGLDLLDLRERLDRLCTGESSDPPDLSVQSFM
jgi:predicted metal-dependent hydrolase